MMQVLVGTLVAAEVGLTVYTLNRVGLLDGLKSKATKLKKATSVGIECFKAEMQAQKEAKEVIDVEVVKQG